MCPVLLFCLTTGIYRAFMNIYLNGKEYKIELHTILSQKLYNQVTPLLAKLEQSKGARGAFESELQKRIFSDSYFSGKINLMKGDEAWNDLRDDMKFQETIAEVMMSIRDNIFDFIRIDDETIESIFDLFKCAINKKKINNNELLQAIDEPSNSEFWQEQDLNEILESLKFFRSTVLARIKTSL